MAEEDEKVKIIAKINPNLKEPFWSHKLVYSSSSETLEPIYFWIIDFMESLGLSNEKLADNFSATPGGGFFSEMGAKSSRMQEEGMKILGAVNQVIKSIINIIYDLKEFEIRLGQYELSKSKNPLEKESGMMGLKQIWMDNVDIKRQTTSIKGMAAQFNYATLIDAFMAAKSLDDADKIDLNDRVKRILKQRLAEFFEWAKRSDIELKKRYEIERSYLKSQVATLKLYSKWVKPYLKAAEQLSMKQGTSPSLVSAFDTIVLELNILGTKKIKVKEEAVAKKLPPAFANIKTRDYFACVFVDFKFRGIPQRVGQQGHYAFGGKVEVDFKAYALNKDEIEKFKRELDKNDMSSLLAVSEDQVSESLEQLQEDLEHFLKEKKEEKKKSVTDTLLQALGLKSTPNQEKKIEKKKEEKKKIDIIKKDSYPEAIIRAYAQASAAGLCFKIFDIYKKAHGMASVSDMSPV